MSKYILAYMDFMSPTGFSRVAHSLLDRLTPYFKENDMKVDLYALNFGLKEDFDYNSQIKVLNPKKFETDSKDPYARLGLLKILSLGSYELLWMLNDISVISPMMSHIDNIKVRKEKEGRTPFKVMLYTPIDSPPLTSLYNGLINIDTIVTYTEYAKTTMYEAFLELGVKPKNTVQVVPHGMDTKQFYPITDIDKSVLREKHGIPTDAIVFGNVNKNQPRKDLGTTLIAFANFKKEFGDKEKYALYLHCYYKDPTGINIQRACESLGLKVGKDVFYPTSDKYMNAEYTTEDMNEIYNCIDVFVNSTMSEGWGLSVTEAMCVGLPIVCPLHTSLNEITDNGSLTNSDFKVHKHFQINDGEYLRFKSDPYEMSLEMYDAVEFDYKIYDKEHRILKYSRKFEEYDWDKIATQFRQHIKNLLS